MIMNIRNRFYYHLEVTGGNKIYIEKQVECIFRL